ncbi:MAG: hypothetical protein K2J63_10405 [Muribaculaceae bacterium]|nr:hypothetical protein [Muribaculaceae bacterium]MDE6795698.1 hypothetical protein [Muribaculaceae bacterium]
MNKKFFRPPFIVGAVALSICAAVTAYGHKSSIGENDLFADNVEALTKIDFDYETETTWVCDHRDTLRCGAGCGCGTTVTGYGALTGYHKCKHIRIEI